MLTLEIQISEIIELEDDNGSVIEQEWIEWVAVGTFKNKKMAKEAAGGRKGRIIRPDGSMLLLEDVKISNESKKIRKPVIEHEKYQRSELKDLMPVERKGRARLVFRAREKYLDK